MRIKYFVLILFFYLQTTMSDPLKNAFRRRYFPATLSGYHGYRRQRAMGTPRTPAGLPKSSPPPFVLNGPPGNMPPGANLPSRGAGSNLPGGMNIPDENLFVEPVTIWAPQPQYRENLTEQCDYIAHYCLRVYTTGEVCGRTVLYSYYTFESYCMMDYVNCMRQFEAWMILHMGPCFNITFPADYKAPDRDGADLAGEFLKNMVLERVAELQIKKRITSDY